MGDRLDMLLAFANQIARSQPLTQQRINDLVCKRDHLSNQWQVGDYYLLFMTQHKIDEDVEIRYHSVSNKALDQVQQKYNYIRTTNNNIPVFTLKEQ